MRRMPDDMRCMLRCLAAAALTLTLGLSALPEPEPALPDADFAIAASLNFAQYDFELCAFSDDFELELLARVLAAEVGGEPYIAQVGYGAMLINRTADPRFPEKLGRVIGDAGLRSAILRYDSGEEGLPARSLRAARSALLGVDPTGGALWCMSASEWEKAPGTRHVAARLGDLVFFK